MKAVLKIQNADGKKLYVASKINSVKLGNRTDIGNDQSLLEVDFRDPANLFEMGKSFSVVKGNEFDAQLKAEAEKAAAAKAGKK